ncbi:VWA domain-containing protein [Cytophagaceae bacterium DM2B3-1]|uniref:VWA domain-containing protein n=1 Tax=Xanthocytophaga flava TaxID=3048013 RepID=A0ABT7CJ40_9BACT|nr:VWA domain-containing protein [Xanthocytophaga flavus]MDJ1493755.1 VWA domain-containing protein [Xanthocytophaga flavus]
MLKPSYSFSQTILPEGITQPTDLLIRFQSDLPQAARRNLNLSLVIDRSGSMAGAPLQHALKAAEAVVNKLEPGDIISIVVYDDNVNTIFGPQPVTDKEAVKTLIHKVRAGGITNLSGGWLQGCEHVKTNYDPQKVNRVLLLTDGHANMGITDPKSLMATAGKKSSEGITTTTLGFGRGFNEDLLIGMAQAATGNFYFIQSIDEASDVFTFELDSLKSVVAQNLSATLELASGIQLSDVLSIAKTQTSANGKTILTLGDIYTGEDKLLGLTLTLPEASKGTLPIGKLAFTAEAVQNGAIQQINGQLDITAQVGTLEESALAPSSGILIEINRLKIAKAKESALELLESGHNADAEQILRTLIRELQEKGLHEHFEIAEEIEQLEYFASRMAQKALGNEGRKELLDQSYQARNRNRADLGSRGVSAGEEVKALKVVTEVGTGVELQCVREGGKLRIKVLSDAYDQDKNVQFPRAIRAENARYVVEGLELSSDGSFYRVKGEINRYAKAGEVDTFASATRTRKSSNGKASAGAPTAADLETTDQVGDGVLVQCVKDGSKLRARVVSDGYESTWNMRFPRSIREEGTLYVVDEVNTAPDGKSYIACGDIKRFVQATVTT